MMRLRRRCVSGGLTVRFGTLTERTGRSILRRGKGGGAYSRPNVERLIWLEERNLLMPEIRDEVLEVIRAPYIFPGDIIDAIKGDLRAWENYQRLGDGYRRIRVAYIDAARKRPEEFRKRLENFILTTREGRLIKGFGGIEKYY